jgi:hypothetical protein
LLPFNPEPSGFPSVAKNLKMRTYKTIILPVILYGCETWSLTPREEHMLRVFENKVLRSIFGPQRDEVTGGWRKLHNEELRDLYSSPSIIRIIKSRRMTWEGHVARMGKKRNAYRLLVGKPEGKRPLGRPRRRWVDNIKIYLLEIGWARVDWMGLAQDRDKWRALVNAVMNHRVSKSAGKLSSGYIIGDLSSSSQFHRVSFSYSFVCNVSFIVCVLCFV